MAWGLFYLMAPMLYLTNTTKVSLLVTKTTFDEWHGGLWFLFPWTRYYRITLRTPLLVDEKFLHSYVYGHVLQMAQTYSANAHLLHAGMAPQAYPAIMSGAPTTGVSTVLPTAVHSAL